MPVVLLGSDPVFPPLNRAEEGGLLAIGGDLSVERLLAAYSKGIFPWYSEGQPILWWSPDPRLVLFPGELHVSRRLSRLMRRHPFKVTWNKAFEEIVRSCAEVHHFESGGTWITEDMIDAYVRLHKAGYACSVESFRAGRLVGGLYGVLVGTVFFGESMFATVPEASNVAFVAMVRKLVSMGVVLIDCQVTTGHLKRFGAREIARAEFAAILAREIKSPVRPILDISRSGGIQIQY